MSTDKRAPKEAGTFLASLTHRYTDSELTAITNKILATNFPPSANGIDKTLNDLRLEHTGRTLDIAIVVLDRDIVEQVTHSSDRQVQLQAEVKGLWEQINSSVETKAIDQAWDVVSKISQDLKEILEAALVGKTSFGYSPDTQTADWLLPYDFIACLKALHVALDPESQHSREMRQGAVGVSRNDHRLAVGTSGLVSWQDEVVSRSTGNEIFFEIAAAARNAPALEQQR